MYLYHMDLISTREEIKEFSPRIPLDRLNGEDNKTKRICVSKNIEGCLGSAPWGGKSLFHMSENTIFRVYKFDVSDIEKNNLLDSDYLIKNNLVEDAEVYDECWIINQNIKPIEVFYINLIKYSTDFEKIVDYEYEVETDYTYLTDLEYEIVDKSELLFGSLLRIDTSFLKQFVNEQRTFDNVKERVVNLIKASYSESARIINDDCEHVVSIRIRNKGLWHDDFVRELEKDFKMF